MKKGITFSALVVMLAIMLTLVTTAVISGVGAINNTTKMRFATELSYVQEVVNSYIDVDYEINFDKTYNINLSNASQDVKLQFVNENMVNSQVNLFEIDQNLEVLKNSDLTYGKKKIGDSQSEKDLDTFLYSATTGRVYYAKGLELNGKLYYTMTDELAEKIDYDYIYENDTNSSNIIFTKTTDEWTNSSISCQIKVPKIYNNINVSVSTDNKAVDYQNEGTAYYVYQIDVRQNCSIQVVYETSRNEIVKRNFDITNVDTTDPVLQVSNINSIFNSQTGTMNRNVQILEHYDNESGIKYLKYEKTEVPMDNIKAYFLNNGILLDSDSITIPDDVENVTIYIEDNAGNYVSIIK